MACQSAIALSLSRWIPREAKRAAKVMVMGASQVTQPALDVQALCLGAASGVHLLGPRTFYCPSGGTPREGCRRFFFASLRGNPNIRVMRGEIRCPNASQRHLARTADLPACGSRVAGVHAYTPSGRLSAAMLPFVAGTFVLPPLACDQWKAA
jgi:hypothetical protein